MSGAGEGRGAGKVILLGEHAVVYGHPALAAALDSGVRAHARVHAGAGAGRLRVPAWGVDEPADSGSPPARALRALGAALELDAAAYDLEAEATVPARAGLGSSAAFAVATARALAAAAGKPLDAEACERTAAAAEAIFHGKASGVDVALATRGGLGLYTRARGLEPLPGVRPFTLVIGLSGEARDTGARVADVARQRDAAPAETEARLARLGELAAHGAHALARGSVRALGPLLDAAQEDLAGLGLSTPRLDALIAAARAAGALGAKLTGAGGGGAMIALGPAGGDEALVAALSAAGAQAGIVTLGSDVVSKATALAHTNIALVKYWGKRDAALNLPARGSLSLTLAGLHTRTSVELDEQLGEDELTLGGLRQEGEPLRRVSKFLDLVRARAGRHEHARVVSENSFPTGSGLASSASAFAALALAATRAAGVTLPDAELSVLARRGSGSAARSIFGGFVEMRAGERADGSDAHALPVLEASAWDVRMVIGIYGGGKPKDVSSRSGMDHTAESSPLYAGWLATVDGDLAAARAAILARDLERLGTIAEASALAMHASAIAARPGVIYWRGATLEALHAVRELRAQGVAAWGTIDAGPHLKVLCAPADAARVERTLAAVPGITSTMASGPGGPAHVLG